MSVSHVAPPHLGLHRRRTHRVSGSVDYHGRARIIFGLIGAVLVGFLILAVIGLVNTTQYTGPSGTVQAMQLSGMAIFWLWVLLMDVVAVLAYLISWAYRA